VVKIPKYVLNNVVTQYMIEAWREEVKEIPNLKSSQFSTGFSRKRRK
jgi:hypothetical protein